MLSGSSLPLALLLVAMVMAGSGGVRSAPPPPSAEMLRALHYIQSLSQRGPPVAPDNQQWEEEGEGQGEDGAEKEWLQAVLETLQETQRQEGRLNTPKTLPQSPSPALTSVSRRRHRKYPLEGGWGNSLKRTNENAQDEQYTPQKLATLQSVFEELQKISASKSRSEKRRQSDYEEEEEEEEDGDEEGPEEEEEEEEEDAERRRKMPVEDWGPLDEDEEQEDGDEEGESDRGELSREEEDDDDDDDLREEDEYDDLLVKRSSQSNSVGRQGAGPADDLSSLVDYYVLSVLERQEQQRRAAQEEEEEEEEEEEGGREAREASLSLMQLLRLSERLGLSPDQLLELLKASSNPLAQQAPARTPQPLGKPPRTPAGTTFELGKPARTPARVQAPPETPYKLKLYAGPAPAADTHSRAHTHTRPGSHTLPQEDLLRSPHARPLEAPEDGTGGATAEILRLLGLPALSAPQRPPVDRQRQRSHDSLQDLLFAQRSTSPLDDPAGHDPAVAPDDAPLERLLLEEAGPEERGLPPRSTGADEEDGLTLRALRRALEDYYLDRPDSEDDTPAGAMETRRSEPDQTTDGDNDDDNQLQRILGFFTPEQQDSSETARFS